MVTRRTLSHITDAIAGRVKDEGFDVEVLASETHKIGVKRMVLKFNLQWEDYRVCNNISLYAISADGSEHMGTVKYKDWTDLTEMIIREIIIRQL